ncbi:MAG: hypothetical protein WCP69_08190 [Bacteroidota bacterium]
MKKQIITAFFIFITGILVAQEVKYVGTSVPVKEHKIVKSSIIGNIDEYVYITTTNKKNYQLKLSMYNKETTVLNKTVAVRSFGKKDNNPIIKHAFLKDILIKNKKIYVVWAIENWEESQLILQIFDKELTEILKPKVIYQLANKDRSFYNSHVFYLMSPDGNMLIAGGEESALKGENIKLQYKLYSSELEVKNTIQAELPYSIAVKTSDISSEYKMSNQGFLFFNVSVTATNNEKTGDIKGQLIGNINSDNSEVKFHVFSFENKQIYNFNYEVLENQLFVFGTYSSKQNLISKKTSTKEKDNYGIFSTKVDLKSFAIIDEIHFNQFDQEKVVYSDYKLSKKGKQLTTKEEVAILLMKGNLVISDYLLTSDNGMLMTLNNQIQINDCTGRSCVYYTNIYGINYVKLDSKGDINWISSTQINAQYPGLSNCKEKLIKKNDKYYTIISGLNKEATIITVEEKTGFITKKYIKKEINEEIVKAVDNQFFVVGLKKRLSAFAIASISGFVLSTAIAAFTLANPFYTVLVIVPAGFYYNFFSSFMPVHNVYFGKYELLN